MASRITPEFCWAEAERLLRLAISSTDRASRSELLEIAAQYRQMAADLQSERADAANSNVIESGGSGTV
jgi:hypothetical protein